MAEKQNLIMLPIVNYSTQCAGHLGMCLSRSSRLTKITQMILTFLGPHSICTSDLLDSLLLPPSTNEFGLLSSNHIALLDLSNHNGPNSHSKQSILRKKKHTYHFIVAPFIKILYGKNTFWASVHQVRTTESLLYFVKSN